MSHTVSQAERIETCIDTLAKAVAVYLLVTGDYSVVDRLAHATKYLDVMEALNSVLREFPRIVRAYSDIENKKGKLAYEEASPDYFKKLMKELQYEEVAICIHEVSREIEKNDKYRIHGIKISSYALGYLSSALLKGIK